MGATSSDGIATAIPIPKSIVAMATKYVNFILVLCLGFLVEEGGWLYVFVGLKSLGV